MVPEDFSIVGDGFGGGVSNLNGTGRGVEEALLTTLMTSLMKLSRGMPEGGAQRR